MMLLERFSSNLFPTLFIQIKGSAKQLHVDYLICLSVEMNIKCVHPVNRYIKKSVFTVH